MKKNPVELMHFTLILMIIFLLATFIIKSRENDLDLPLATAFLVISMSSVYTAFKHQQQRITALEEKLEEQSQMKE